MDNLKDILGMRLGQMKSLLDLAISEDGFNDLDIHGQAYYLETVSNLVDGALEANKDL